MNKAAVPPVATRIRFSFGWRLALTSFTSWSPMSLPSQPLRPGMASARETKAIIFGSSPF
jgi:hypothetical protein